MSDNDAPTPLTGTAIPWTCQHCGRPILESKSVWIGANPYHAACTQPPETQRIADLERQLAEARRDKERLLDAAKTGLEFAECEPGELKYACRAYPSRYAHEEMLVAEIKAAIDATMEDAE